MTGLQLLEVEKGGTNAIEFDCGRRVYLLSPVPRKWLDRILEVMERDQTLVLGLCFDGHAAVTRDFPKAAIEALRRGGYVSPPFSEDLWLILTEMIANALLHGNLRGVPPREASEEAFSRGIAVGIGCANGEISLFIGNDPSGDSVATAIQNDDVPEEAFRAGGYGLAILHGLGGRVSHNEDLSEWRVILPITTNTD